MTTGGVGAAIHRAWFAWRADRSIRRHGWALAYATNVEIPFANTIGFGERARSPEVIVFSLSPDEAAAVLTEVYQGLRTGGLVLRDGELWPSPAECLGMWRAVHPSQVTREHFGPVLRHYLRKGLSPADLAAFQLVLSDGSDRFPWHPAYNPADRPQEALYEPS